MGQNLAVQTSLAPGGGVTFNNQDEHGNLKTFTYNPSYNTVAASQTKQKIGGGAVGDVLSSIVIIPATTSPGAVTLYDGQSGTGIVLFAGGASSVVDLKPISVLGLGLVAANATSPGWYVTTGENVSVIVSGNF